MANNDMPAWLKVSGNDEESLEKTQSGEEISGPPREREGKAKIIYWALKIVTMSLCLLMAATSVIGLTSITGVDNSGRIFVAVYMFFFASLLFAFESVQIRSIEVLEHVFRRNFGFLYNTLGKSLFIIFIAFLSFGLGDPVTLSFITGLLFASFGVSELALYLKFPELFE